jgi:DNA-binding NarL/FixJ family response regulator
VSLAFLPLSHPLENDDPLVLVQLSRLPPSDNMALTMFARAQELSPTEESVMMALCKGWDIPDIAKSHRVAESTIRSQIKAIR